MNTWSLIIAGLLAFLPVSEVRGAIPYVFLVANTPFERALGLVVSVVCNMLVVPAAFALLDLLGKLVESKRTPGLIKRFYNWLLAFGRRRSLGVKKESYIALALFVGVPLPATGAWTGSLVAYVLGLERKKSIIAIEAGVVIASLLVFLAVYTGIEVLLKLFTG